MLRRPHTQIDVVCDLLTSFLKGCLGVFQSMAIPQRQDGDLVANTVMVKAHQPPEIGASGHPLSDVGHYVDQTGQMLAIDVESQRSCLDHHIDIVISGRPKKGLTTLKTPIIERTPWGPPRRRGPSWLSGGRLGRGGAGVGQPLGGDPSLHARRTRAGGATEAVGHGLSPELHHHGLTRL